MKTPASGIALALALAVLPLSTTGAAAQTEPAAKATSIKSYEVDIAATKEWVDTKIDVRGGAKLRFTATGEITYPPDESRTGKTRTRGTFGPDGLPRGFADLIHQYPVRDAG